jgi:hypothetical protein
MNKALPAQGLEMTISYLHLMSYCPPEYIFHFRESSSRLRTALAHQAELSEDEYFARVIPAACRRIVSFHHNTREPDEAVVAKLTKRATFAGVSPLAAWKFSRQMNDLASQKKNQKLELCHQKGFKISDVACQYLLFALVSKPNYQLLKVMLETEAQKSINERDPVEVMWTFTLTHLRNSLGTKQAYISANHLGNLAYCLLSLGMNKSRYPFPEEPAEILSRLNQTQIASWN